MIDTKLLIKMLNKIIDLSSDNTAGLVMSRRNITDLLSLLWKCRSHIHNIDIDSYMMHYESDCGFLMKASDFEFVIENVC